MTKKTIFTSPQEVETAFYEALEGGNLDAMMSVWAEDEEIVCILPGSPRLTGYTLVRDAWQQVFDSNTRLRIQLLALSTVHSPFTAVHSVIEQIGVVGNKQLSAPVAATNVYVRSPLGWRMIVHHASAVPPSSINTVPQVLH